MINSAFDDNGGLRSELLGQIYDDGLCNGYDWKTCYPYVEDGIITGFRDAADGGDDWVVVDDSYAAPAHKYSIWTDGESMDDIIAVDLASALDQFGSTPADVRDDVAFSAWLESVGGYGHIDCDGVRIVSVNE